MKEHVKNVATKKNPKKPRNDEGQNTGKKPFDKRKYRLQKYSNKYKINQWEDRRKKAILRDYYKEVDKTQRHNFDKTDSKDEVPDKTGKTEQQKKMSAFYKAKQEFIRKKNEKKLKREEMLRVKAEREEALQKYKEKKMQAYKKLSKKTRKGQPVMKDRLEMLLQKIQHQTSD